MKTLNIMYLIILSLLLILPSGCSVVQPGYHGMKWSPWGKGLKTDKVYPHGVVWHWPWNNVLDYSLQWQTYQEKVAILTADELHINVTVSVTLRPVLAELPDLELEVGRNYYQSVVRPEFFSLTRNVFSYYKYGVISPESPEIEAEIYKRLVVSTEGKHLEFDNITIDHIVYPQVVTSAVDRKLAVEQDIEQKGYEVEIAEKEAEIQRVLARGQRDAQQIINSGLTKHYLQYKALEVQDKLSTSANTKFFFVPIGEDGLPIIVDTGE